MAKKEMTLLEKAGTVLKDPKGFFDAIKREDGVKNAFIFIAAASLVPTVISILAAALGLSQAANAIESLGFLSIYLLIPVFYVLSVLLYFVQAGILHIFVFMAGGKKGYHSTYKALAYGNLPSTLVSWIPLIGFIGTLWSLYLVILGISKLHEITMLRALIAVIVPALAIFLFIVFAAAFWALGGFNPGISPILAK
ncbi:MAG: YIP1 family protein [Candidatus Aenigmarchaeota archaeon]|nr:YIP1 family protein [Candidatus Aenigmarchaeota archaeon]